MNIGFDALYIAGNSGISVYTRSLISALARSNSDTNVRLFSTFRKEQQIRSLFASEKGIECQAMFPHPLMFGSIAATMVDFWKMRRWQSAAQTVDIVHCTDPEHFPRSIRNAVATVHDVIPLYDKSWARRNPSEKIFSQLKEISRKARAIIAPSEFSRQEIISKMNINPDRVFTVYEGAHTGFRFVESSPVILKKFGLSPEKPFFLYVGRIDPRKNLENTMRAYSELPADIRRNHPLVFVSGANEHIRREVEAKAEKIGIKPNFVLASGVTDEELPHFYSSALALVFVSFSEGFGLPLLEAMQCACPAIIANSSCLPEIAGEASVAVDEESSAEISRAMLRFAEDQQYRQIFVNAGLERAQFFSWDKAAKETLKVYSFALGTL